MKIKSVTRFADTNTVEVAWESLDGKRAKCRSYSGSQMAELRADMSAEELVKYGDILTVVEFSYAAPVPTAEDIVREAQRQQDELDLAEIKAMPFINYLVTHKPNQIASKVTTDIAADGIEAVMIKLAKALAVLAKDKFR